MVLVPEKYSDGWYVTVAIGYDNVQVFGPFGTEKEAYEKYHELKKTYEDSP